MESNMVHQRYGLELMKALKAWRFVILLVRPIILWEKYWYPVALIGFISTVFTFLYIIELSTISTLALIALVINIINFTLPMYTINATWTNEDQALYEEFCNDVAVTTIKAVDLIKYLFIMRAEIPLLFFTIAAGVLYSIIYISNSVNNTLLLCLISIGIVLCPGLKRTKGFKLIVKYIDAVCRPEINE